MIYDVGLTSTRRFELPMMIAGAEALAMPDSGSIENIVSEETAARLHLELDDDEQH
jgi:hypothetical protein